MHKVNLNEGEKFCGAFPAGSLVLHGTSEIVHEKNSWIGMRKDGVFFLEYYNGEREFLSSWEHEDHLLPKLVLNNVLECVEVSQKQASWSLGVHDQISFPLETKEELFPFEYWLA